MIPHRLGLLAVFATLLIGTACDSDDGLSGDDDIKEDDGRRGKKGGKKGGGKGAGEQAGGDQADEDEDGFDPFAGKGKGLQRVSIDIDKHPEAVCNDGTTPVFFMRPGAEPENWVVYFKGGGSCVTEEDCKSRPKDLKSSDPWLRFDQLTENGNPASTDGKAGGILSADPEINPDLHAWNHVYMVYCSSDQWAGDRGASDATYGMHFRGRKIVHAMFDAMKDPQIVGSSTIDNASRVILGGSSAGAAGLRNNIDRVAADLKGVDVRGFSDAGITPAITPKRAGGGNDGERDKGNARIALWNPQLPLGCVKAKSAADKYLCMEGRNILTGAHISAPMFFHMDQRDPKVMGAGGDRTREMNELAREAAAEIRDTFALSTCGGGICPAAGNHIVLNGTRFNKPSVDGLSPAQVFGNWYFDRDGPKKAIDSGADDGGKGRGDGGRTGGGNSGGKGGRGGGKGGRGH
jgi:hypothetical protein